MSRELYLYAIVLFNVEFPLAVVLLLEVPARCVSSIRIGTLRRQTWFPCTVYHLARRHSEVLIVVLGSLRTEVALRIELECKVQTLSDLPDPCLRDVGNQFLSSTLGKLGIRWYTWLAYSTYTGWGRFLAWRRSLKLFLKTFAELIKFLFEDLVNLLADLTRGYFTFFLCFWVIVCLLNLYCLWKALDL